MYRHYMTLRVVNAKHRTRSIRNVILKELTPNDPRYVAVDKWPSNWSAIIKCPALTPDHKCNLTRRPQARIEHKKGHAFLFIRGTRLNVHDLFQDARLKMSNAEHPLEGRVHSGFHALYKNMRPALVEAIDKLSIRNLTIVGVSMGAAISLMLAIYLKKTRPNLTVNLITALMPPVGNEQFMQTAHELEQQTHFIAKRNIVSTIHLKKSANDTMLRHAARTLLRMLGYSPLVI